MSHSRSEVRQHSTRKSCWVIINNTVYDITEFVDSHPGGSGILLKYAGRDATEAFEPLHRADTLEKYLTSECVQVLMIHMRVLVSNNITS